MKKILFAFFVISLIYKSGINASSMKETVVVGHASALMCRNYAIAVGGDVEKFADLVVMVLKISETMGYTEDFQSYSSGINILKEELQKQLLQKYGSKKRVYNEWCVEYYSKFSESYNKGLQ